ncbi:MAG: hypothetical protein P9F75_02685 [Candidatus Contendobacter sp.]|nr:hypothetical protein [Candidatus Contendobacter sp.]
MIPVGLDIVRFGSMAIPGPANTAPDTSKPAALAAIRIAPV